MADFAGYWILDIRLLDILKYVILALWSTMETSETELFLIKRMAKRFWMNKYFKVTDNTSNVTVKSFNKA